MHSEVKRHPGFKGTKLFKVRELRDPDVSPAEDSDEWAVLAYFNKWQDWKMW
jgi:hypothetical protein